MIIPYRMFLENHCIITCILMADRPNTPSNNTERTYIVATCVRNWVTQALTSWFLLRTLHCASFLWRQNIATCIAGVLLIHYGPLCFHSKPLVELWWRDFLKWWVTTQFITSSNSIIWAVFYFLIKSSDGRYSSHNRLQFDYLLIKIRF